MDYEIIGISKKKINDSSRVYCLDKKGNLCILLSLINAGKQRFNDQNNKNLNSKKILKKLYEINLEEKLKSLLGGRELKCYNMKRLQNEQMQNEISDNNNYNYQEIFLINSNLGLIKLALIGKNDFNLRIVYNNLQEKNLLTAFDLSDDGLIIAAFSDMTVKVLELDDFSNIFQINVELGNINTVLNKIFWASVICKNEKKKLIRKSLIANFFVISSKNDFIIYDLNQKNKSDVKKIKKKIELGSKKNLNRKSSIIEFS